MRKSKERPPRLMLTLAEDLIRALKVRAAQEGTTVSKLVTAWVRTWTVPRRRRRGGAR